MSLYPLATITYVFCPCVGVCLIFIIFVYAAENDILTAHFWLFFLQLPRSSHNNWDPHVIPFIKLAFSTSMLLERMPEFYIRYWVNNKNLIWLGRLGSLLVKCANPIGLSPLPQPPGFVSSLWSFTARLFPLPFPCLSCQSSLSYLIQRKMPKIHKKRTWYGQQKDDRLCSFLTVIPAFRSNWITIAQKWSVALVYWVDSTLHPVAAHQLYHMTWCIVSSSMARSQRENLQSNHIQWDWSDVIYLWLDMMPTGLLGAIGWSPYPNWCGPPSGKLWSDSPLLGEPNSQHYLNIKPSEMKFQLVLTFPHKPEQSLRTLLRFPVCEIEIVTGCRLSFYLFLFGRPPPSHKLCVRIIILYMIINPYEPLLLRWRWGVCVRAHVCVWGVYVGQQQGLKVKEQVYWL